MPNYITLETAAQCLNQAARISVIGCSGGGKSTLSQRLANALNLEYISITTRPDMANDCVEQLPDREFLSYIWNFEKDTVPIVIRQLEAHGGDVPVLVLNSRGEMELFACSVGA